MNSPLVSIIIPTFNQRKDFLHKCIESAILQTYPNIEVILSDNHSTNNIQEILSIFDNNPKFKVVRPENHVKIVPNFIFGASQAKGDYISFLSSDDYLYPDAIESVMNLIADKPDIVLGYGEIEAVSHNDLNQILFACRNYQKKSGVQLPKQSFQLFYKGNVHSCWIIGGIIKKEFYNQVFESALAINYGFDTSLGIKLHELGKIGYINKPVSKWRIWREEDGKVDAKRYIADIEDVCYIYEIIESSPILLSYLKYGNTKMKLQRYWRCLKFTIILIIKYGQNLVSISDLPIAIKLLNKLSKNSILFSILFFSLRQPTVSILSVPFRIYYRIKNN